MAASNHATSAAWDFHNATKYVLVDSDDPAGEMLIGDPAHHRSAMGEQSSTNEPPLFKRILELPQIRLPHPTGNLAMPALAALTTSIAPDSLAIPTIDDIARILHRTNGLLKVWTSPRGRTIPFRAAGCTGARYHIELYLVATDLPGLAAGVYHYDAEAHALTLIRAGDFRGAVVSATAAEPAIASAPAIVITTSEFWRNAWRYQERAYRHAFWDTGTQLANLLGMTTALGLPARVVLGFVDAEINTLIGVDGVREAALSLVAIGNTPESPPLSPPVTELRLATNAQPDLEIAFPVTEAMHAASCLRSSAEVDSWRHSSAETQPAIATGERIPLDPLPNAEWPSTSLEDVIASRRSFRKYDLATGIDPRRFATVLTTSAPRPEFECLLTDAAPASDRSVIVNRVAGLPGGIYHVAPDSQSLVAVMQGPVDELAFRLACGQEYAGEAHVNVYETAVLEPLLARFGNRGYRVAQLAAALAGARLQLAAHAFGYGAVGSTSLDDEVTAALSGDGDPAAFMFIAVFGERRPKAVLT